MQLFRVERVVAEVGGPPNPVDAFDGLEWVTRQQVRAAYPDDAPDALCDYLVGEQRAADQLALLEQ